MDDLEDIKQRLTKVEAENAREWDIIKSFFAGGTKQSLGKGPPFPKVKLNKRTWVFIIIWQVVGLAFKWLPIEEMFF